MFLKFELALHALEWRMWGGATVEPGPHNAEWFWAEVRENPYGEKYSQPEDFRAASGYNYEHLSLSWNNQD
jgi:hypothetical protein